jgi:hypothetical protein
MDSMSRAAKGRISDVATNIGPKRGFGPMLVTLCTPTT